MLLQSFCSCLTGVNPQPDKKALSPTINRLAVTHHAVLFLKICIQERRMGQLYLPFGIHVSITPFTGRTKKRGSLYPRFPNLVWEIASDQASPLMSQK
jgi:hypothetical protein